MVRATYWAIFFTKASGHPGPCITPLRKFQFYFVEPRIQIVGKFFFFSSLL
jgi:hypothetical protein